MKILQTPLFDISVIGIGAIYLAVTLSAQDARPAAALPQRDQLSVQDVKDALADCTIQMREESRYEQKLISRIRELEGELTKLKSDAKPAVKP